MTQQKSNSPAVPGKPGQTPAPVTERTIVDSVLEKVTKFQETGELQIPKDYSPENALKSAYLILVDLKDKDGKPALQVCTRESIANSLLEMVVQGLSPMKKQCAFIVYGNKVQLQREYPGTIALAKRFGNVKDVAYNVIYEGDKFEFKIDPLTGRKSITNHETSLDNIDVNKIKGVYAVLVFEDGTSQAEIMTMAQVRQAWNQGPMKGQSSAHKNFPDQMALKTVIGRACKPYINSSDDEDVYEEPPQAPQAQVKTSEKPKISFEDAKIIPDDKPNAIPQNTAFDSQSGDGLTDADKAALNAQVQSEGNGQLPGF